MKEFFVLCLIGTFSALSKGRDSCDEKECLIQGQICVMNDHYQAECKCREACPRSSHRDRVCGSDGITYRSRCALDVTSCRLSSRDRITMVSNGSCPEISLKVGAAHRASQTLLLGRKGEIHCNIEGNVAQILWKKLGAKRRLPFSRVRTFNSKILRFRNVLQQDAGKYECRAFSGSSSARAFVDVVVVDPVSIDTNVTSTQDCNLEKLIGTGINFTTRWYFDVKSANCQPFSYSGVGGNANNFENELLCLQKCSHAAGDICSLPKRPGPCMGYFPRWFYNAYKGKCRKFIFGGCHSNANNFHSKSDCEDTCSGERICRLPPVIGPCRAHFSRYFYNTTSKQCEKFIFGGCQGNSNNFPTSELCQDKCQEDLPVAQIIKSPKVKPGRCPWQRSPSIFCIRSQDACQSDGECQGSQKCCQFGCGKACALPVSENKPGKCPIVEKNKKLCNKKGDMCSKDNDCPGLRKCCFNGCQKDCSVSVAAKLVKPGVCLGLNAINPELCKNTLNECEQDADCYGRLKCCFNGCFNECTKRPRPAPKQGICPEADYIPRENCSDTEDKCNDDTQCPGRDKCCATGCLQECITPPFQTKPRICPILDVIPREFCNVTEDQCAEDLDCEGRDKCCATGCIKECITPPTLRRRQEKPGECPLSDYIPPELCEVREDECTTDNDCESNGKCCATGCVQECVIPPREIQVDRGESEQCPKPWKKQPCDRRGDMCDTDGDCGDGGQRCCFNGCQKDCVRLASVNLTKCQEERIDALNKLSQDPPLLGVFVPNCKPDGQYEDKQCHELYCWCVGENGERIPGTTVRGSSMVCYPREKPGKCPKPWKGQNGICDRLGTTCRQDSDCREDNKCCFNGCQNDCVPSVGVKICEKHRDEQITKITAGFVGVFIPSCKVMNGDYEEIQCHGSSGYCWCVDDNGNELPGTRTRDEPDCTNSVFDKGTGKKGTCPEPWKGKTGFCDKMGDECGMDYHCGQTEKCCFSGCQRMCVNSTETHQREGTRPGKCPKPWLGQEGLCDRRSDMCLQDVDCKESEICCFNGCQKECVSPGLTTCQRRYEESFKFPPLGRFVPRCEKDGGFQRMQCQPSSSHCWCVNSYGVELLGTRRTRGRPNCAMSDPCASTHCPFNGKCVVSNDRKSVECKCIIGCVSVYEPLCGTDGNTYDNECSLKGMACLRKKSVTVAYKGECVKVDLCASVKCEFFAECVIVNGSAACVCPGSQSHPICGDEKKPVCGSDGVLYDSICRLMNASCHKQAWIKPALPENCEQAVDPCSNVTCSHPLQQCKLTAQGKPVCECEQIACTRIYRPVCGTNGQTYSNECMMKLLSCEANLNVTEAHKGECTKTRSHIKPVNCPKPWKGQNGICDRRGSTCRRDSDCRLDEKCCFNGCQSDCVLSVADICSSVTCSHPAARCIATNKTATCVCPNIVTLEYFPVCGSNGVTYPNPGSLWIASCNSNGAIYKLHDGRCSKLQLAQPCEVGVCSHKLHRCEVQNGIAECICSTACTFEYAPVCASDNKTYPNKCAMEVAECEKGHRLRVVKSGQCADPCSGMKCPSYSMCKEVNGIGSCVCPQVCPALFAPVCGSDGKVYDNECQMKVASCTEQKNITLASKETCEPDPCKLSKCSHPLHKCVTTSSVSMCICPPSACTMEYAPVCGSDGKTYPNNCVLKEIACERSQNITLANQGECEEDVEDVCGLPALCSHPHHQCQMIDATAMCMCPMIIPANLDPVCGSDGETYSNTAALKSLSCLANRIVEVQHRGTCVVPVDPCDTSICNHPRQRCEVVDGLATCVCSEACPFILMPVCGSDGYSYPNNCSLEVEACTSGKNLTVIAMGECDKCSNKTCSDSRQYCRVVNDTAICECNEMCTFEWSPVCGSDGRTYPNQCHLEVESCKSGKTLTVVKPGECGSDVGRCPELNHTLVCEEEITGCRSDDECALGQTCCLQGNCTRACVAAKAIPPPPQLQICPVLDPTPACQLSPDATPNCFTGGPACPAGQACCLDKDCNHKCVKSALNDGSRPGKCPILNPMLGCASISGCDSDKRCALGKRCCLQSDCKKKCVTTDVSPSNPPIIGQVSEKRHGPPTKESCNPTCHRFAKCTRNPKTGEHRCSCSRPCLRIYKPVCGTDGVTYSSECMLMYLVCQDGTDISVKHPGRCFDKVSPPGEQVDRCPKLNPMPGCSLGMTGCSGDSECPDGQLCCLQRDCTRQCYAPEKPGQCPVFKRKACPLISKPDGCSTDWDCAGDRKCCSDGCSKECSSSFLRGTGGNPCESAFCNETHPVCRVIGSNATCQCRQQCPVHKNPVCGSDGRTYDNMCLLEVTACIMEDGGMPAGQLTYIGNGHCTVAQKCSLPPLTGRCFASMKRFFFNATSRKCEEFKFGGCEGNENRFDTIEQCKDYCGALDACQLDPCPDPYSICSISDSGERKCECPAICPKIYSPVCGSDGNNYSNECQMKVSACRQGMMIKVTSQGQCRGFCPTVDPRMCSVSKDLCSNDTSCLSNEKCCHDGCRMSCVSPLSVPNHLSPSSPNSDDPCLSHECPFYGVCRVAEHGNPVCECIIDCPVVNDPVCGSDGKNYSSECTLKSQACQTKTFVRAVGGPAKCTVNKVRCNWCPSRSNLFSNFCESDFAIEGSLEEIKSTDGDNSTVLMVKVMGVFKGTDAIQNKIIKIDFTANLKSCFCRELQLKKVLVIVGSTTSGGEYFLKEKSSFVRHTGKRLLEKVQQHAKRNKCSKMRNWD